MSAIRVGDRVSWSTPQGRTQGEVVERKEGDFTFEGQDFTASRDDPRFIVESEKTGAKAAHAPGALRKLSG